MFQNKETAAILVYLPIPPGIAQFRYFNIQPKTIDTTTRLRGINPTNSIVYSPEPRTEVKLYFYTKMFFCFRKTNMTVGHVGENALFCIRVTDTLLV